MENFSEVTPIATSIAPWLTVSDGAKAVNFYKSAFGAIELYRLEDPDGGVVAKLSVDGAAFWLSGATPGSGNPSIESLVEASVRMVLTVTNPDTFFTKALEAGASEVFAVGEDYGWRLGRVVDPFGHHWEIGRPLDA